MTQFDVAGMLRVHSEQKHKVTMAVHEYVHVVPFGVVETNNGRVAGLREKPTQTWQTNAGVYVLAPEVIGRVPTGVSFPLPALIEDCLERGENVGVFSLEEDWIDVGRHQELQRARGQGAAS